MTRKQEPEPDDNQDDRRYMSKIPPSLIARMIDEVDKEQKRKKRRFLNGWGMWGIIATLLVGAAGIYFGSKIKHKPHLVFEVITTNRVLELREDIADLDILYKQQSIRKADQMLTVMTVRVANVGSAGIEPTQYSPNEDVGFVIGSGTIVATPSIVGFSDSAYVRRSPIVFHPPDSVMLKRLIINEDHYFVLKMTILHPEQATPFIAGVTGQIANADSIEVIAAGVNRQETDGPLTYLNQRYPRTTFLLMLLFGYLVAMVVVDLLRSFSRLNPYSRMASAILTEWRASTEKDKSSELSYQRVLKDERSAESIEDDDEKL